MQTSICKEKVFFDINLSLKPHDQLGSCEMSWVYSRFYPNLVKLLKRLYLNKTNMASLVLLGLEKFHNEAFERDFFSSDNHISS